MKFITYLKYQNRLFLFVVVLLSFITLLILLQPKYQLPFTNILYMYIVCFFFLSLYWLLDYHILQTYYKKTENLFIQGQRINNLNTKPITYEQHLYEELLQRFTKAHTTHLSEIDQKKNETLQFMTSWVHDIKMPISVCRLIIENSSENQELKSIDEEIDKIEKSVEQALYFVRSDDFHQDYFIEEQSITAIVTSVLKKHSKLFIGKKLQLSMQLETLDILTDIKWLSFIFSQVIHNSIKYSDVGGTIQILSEEDTKEFRLIIIDDGAGIAKEDLQRVFEKGFTGKNGRKYGHSTGMGLFLAQSLANKLGHYLSIESEENERTKTVIHFPKLRDFYTIT